MEHTYESALKIIECRQRRARPSGPSAQNEAKPSSSSSGTPGLRGSPGIEGMSEWLHMLGYTQTDLSALNIIHIAGTKGKGSTCAFTESLLRHHGQRTSFPRKTGLYTSPHLIRPEERIRINSHPLAPELMAKYLFELHAQLPQLQSPFDPSKPPIERGPRYLQLLFLLAIHTFLREKVDVAIIETHCGGEYDATNFLARPLVTAITTLGMDHVDMLGPTVENIAWHKAGIFKVGARALSAVQDGGKGVVDVLRERAGEKGGRVEFVDEDSRLPVGLSPAVQRKNASLALAVAEAWLQRTTSPSPQGSHKLDTDTIQTGITRTSWPGRFQILPDPGNANITWYLDAAHNELSVSHAATWYSDITTTTTTTIPSLLNSSAFSSSAPSIAGTKILIFTHVNELRDAKALLYTLASSLREARAEIEHVVFTTPHLTQTGAEEKGASVPVEWREIWGNVFGAGQVYERVGIEDTVTLAREIVGGCEGKRAHVLVTGSQYLVGPVLGMLDRGVSSSSES